MGLISCHASFMARQDACSQTFITAISLHSQVTLMIFVVTYCRGVQRCCSVLVARQQSPPTLVFVGRAVRTCTSVTSVVPSTMTRRTLSSVTPVGSANTPSLTLSLRASHALPLIPLSQRTTARRCVSVRV